MLRVGWCLDNPCGGSITGSLEWRLSLCSWSQYQLGALLPVDVCVDMVHWLSLWGEIKSVTCVFYNSEVKLY